MSKKEVNRLSTADLSQNENQTPIQPIFQAYPSAKNSKVGETYEETQSPVVFLPSYSIHGPDQDVDFFYTRYHLSELQSCTLIFSTNLVNWRTVL